MNIFLIIFRAALFYLIPSMIGYLLYSMAETVKFKKRSIVGRVLNSIEAKLLGEINFASALKVLRVPWFFSIGTIFLLLSATVISALTSLIPSVQFSHAFLPFSYSLFFIGGMMALLQFVSTKSNISLKELKPLSIVIGTALLVALIWNRQTPYSLNWDLYEHQTVSRLIQEGRFDFQTVNISDTFGFSSYPPTFHLLLGVSEPLMEEDPVTTLLYWQYLGYIHLLTVSVTSYYLGLAISRDRKVALLSGILGSTIFESVIAFTSLFILPQTLTATVFAASYAGLLLTAEKKSGRIPPIMIGILAICFILMHYVVGTLAAVMLIGSYALLYLKPLKKYGLWITGAISILTLIFVALSYGLDLSWINSGEAASYTFSLKEKFDYALSIYGGSLFIFSILGGWGLYKSNVPNKRLLMLIYIGFIGLLLSNLPYVLKFFTIGRYFFHALMAFGITYILRFIKNNWLKNIAIAITTIIFLMLFTLNTAQWKQHVSTDTQYTHISADDIATAEFLQEYIKSHPGTLLLSDPTTMYLMEGLSGVNTPGGVFATKETRKQLYEALSKTSLSEKTAELTPINDALVSDNNRILVLSGRTYKWYFASEEYRNGFDFNVWKPVPLSFYDHVELDSVISNTTKTLYSNPSYVVIEINN